MPLLSFGKIALVVILTLVVPKVYKMVNLMKFGKVVFLNQPGPCENLQGIEHGSEDMQALPNGLAFITSGLRFNVDDTKPPFKGRKGKIFLFDFNNPSEAPIVLKIRGDFDVNSLNPHGLSIWQDQDGISLLVVNHRPDAEVIERFTFDLDLPTELQYAETFSGPIFHFPNDVVALGHREFYFTNYAHYYGHENHLWSMLEMYTVRRWGNIAYFDGQEARVLVSGLFLANGINRSPDNRLIYLSHIGDQEIIVYERQPNASLVEKQVYKTLAGAVDNIDVDPVTGDLWVGLHPIPHLTMEHMNDPAIPSPSQVLRLKTEDGLIREAVNIYTEEGTRYIAGSTVAIKYGDYMLAGTINNRAVLCRIMYEV